MVGLADPEGLFQPEGFYDSMKMPVLPFRVGKSADSGRQAARWEVAGRIVFYSSSSLIRVVFLL